MDQRQDKIEDFVKIYGSHEYAQTFVPTMLNLTELKIYIGRKGIASYEQNNNNNGRSTIVNMLMSRIERFFSRFFGGRVSSLAGERMKVKKNTGNANVNSFFLGSLYIEIYEGTPMNGRHLKEIEIEPSKISKSGAWLSIDIGMILPSWNKHYSIVLWQSGGNERNYYKWYYATGNPYPNGSFYYLERGWKEDTDKDFAFITYGEPTGDEPDGIEERWAVIIGGPNRGENGEVGEIDVRIMRDVLVQRGWNPSHIWTIYPEESTVKNIENAIKQMEKNEDMDDICLVSWGTHGGFDNKTRRYYIYVKGVITGEKLDSWLDGFACKGMLLIAQSCYSGGAIYNLAQPKRVIITSVREDQFSSVVFSGPRGHRIYYGGWLFYFLADQTGFSGKKYGVPPKDPIVGYKDGAFARTDPDTSAKYGGNNDGWISAEEAYRFVYKCYDDAFAKWPPDEKPEPQFYDGYDGDLNIVRWKE